MRNCWLFALLAALPLAGHAVPGNDDKVTLAELAEVHFSEGKLTERQAAYLMDVARIAQHADQAAWAQYDRGLFCLPPKTRITAEFLQSVVVTEMGSDRGFAYLDRAPIDRMLIGALTFQYPCTDAAVAEHKRDQEVFMKEVFDLIETK